MRLIITWVDPWHGDGPKLGFIIAEAPRDMLQPTGGDNSVATLPLGSAIDEWLAELVVDASIVGVAYEATSSDNMQLVLTLATDGMPAGTLGAYYRLAVALVERTGVELQVPEPSPDMFVGMSQPSPESVYVPAFAATFALLLARG